MSTPRHSRYSDAQKATGPIRFTVRSPEGQATYEMPRSDRPVTMIPVVTADMLDGATLCIGGYDPTPQATWVTAFVPKPESTK